MNKDTLKGNWTQLKGKIKQKWGKLTDNDVTQINGSYEELEGKLQTLYGIQREEAEKNIKAFLKQEGFEERETERTAR